MEKTKGVHILGTPLTEGVLIGKVAAIVKNSINDESVWITVPDGLVLYEPEIKHFQKLQRKSLWCCAIYKYKWIKALFVNKK